MYDARSGRLSFGLWFLVSPAALVLLLSVLFRCAEAANAVDPQASLAAAFLSSYGWETEEASCEITEITVPVRFNAVYEGYNALQQAQGFDLARYRGEALRRVSFTVTNYPGYEGSGLIRANVLMDGTAVVAADLCSVELGGFIRGVTPGG